jgi:hypothetical protein
MGGTADKRTRVSGEGDKIGGLGAQESRKGLKRRGDIFGGGAEGGDFVPAFVRLAGQPIESIFRCIAAIWSFSS